MLEPDCFLRYRICAVTRNFTSGKSDVYVLAAAVKRGFTKVLFTEPLSRRNTFVGGTCAPPSALLVSNTLNKYERLISQIIDDRHQGLLMRCGGLRYSSGAKLDFCGWGSRFQKARGTEVPKRGPGTQPQWGFGEKPPGQNLSLKCMKHRKKTVFRIYRPMHAVHIHALIFPICAMRFKTKIVYVGVTCLSFCKCSVKTTDTPTPVHFLRDLR